MPLSGSINARRYDISGHQWSGRVMDRDDIDIAESCNRCHNRGSARGPAFDDHHSLIDRREPLRRLLGIIQSKRNADRDDTAVRKERSQGMKQQRLSTKLEERFPRSAHPLSGAGGRDRHPDTAGVPGALSSLCGFYLNRHGPKPPPFPP
jgi:hypothetical protein